MSCPTWQWESLITRPTRLVAITSASSTLGTVTDLRAVTKLVHDVGGLVVVDHSAAAPYRLIDIDEIDADVVAVNAIAWGGPPIGALVFRDPSMIDIVRLGLAEPVCRPDPRDSRWVRTSSACSQAWLPASNTWPDSMSRRTGSRRERLSVSMQSASTYMNRLFDYLLMSLRSLPR